MTEAPDQPRSAPRGSEGIDAVVETWHATAQEVVALLRSLDAAEWSLPTDLPGWDVRAVAAHLAHLESELAGNPQQQVEVAPAPHIRGLMGQFTESGVVARASWSTERIVDELESSVASRYDGLRTDPPGDLSATGPGFAAIAGWSWKTLLSNRCVDMWMHEQDIRRATGRPGGLEGSGATHVAATYAKSLPYVLGKKVAAPTGTTVVLEVTGAQARTVTATVGADGRGAPLDAPPPEPTARLVLDFATWMVLAGGRRAPGEVEVSITGDGALGRSVLENLAVTP